jgi:hypothetical protein
MFLKTLGGRAIVASMLLPGRVLTADNASAADLSLAARAVARSEAPPTPEARKQLLQEFKQFLKQRSQPH